MHGGRGHGVLYKNTMTPWRGKRAAHKRKHIQRRKIESVICYLSYEYIHSLATVGDAIVRTELKLGYYELSNI